MLAIPQSSHAFHPFGHGRADRRSAHRSAWGAATAAYLDLIIRSSPRGLQGTTFMMSGGLFYVGQRFGDVLGTSVYDYYHSFTPCVIMITIVYASILPMLLLVPKSLIAFADGETTDFETAAFAER